MTNVTNSRPSTRPIFTRPAAQATTVSTPKKKIATPKLASPSLASPSAARAGAAQFVKAMQELTRGNKSDAQVAIGVKKLSDGLSYESAQLLWTNDGKDLRSQVLDTQKTLAETRPNLII